MMFLWIVSGVSLLLATVSWARARRAARGLDELSSRYWALRYEVGELRVQLERLTAGTSRSTAEAPEATAGRVSSGRVTEAFVPLTTLKR